MKTANFTLTFEIPVNEVGVSKDGLYWNLPFFLRGGTFKHGKNECEAVISKGRIIIRTKAGREDADKVPHQGKTVKTDVADLF